MSFIETDSRTAFFGVVPVAVFSAEASSVVAGSFAATIASFDCAARRGAERLVSAERARIQLYVFMGYSERPARTGW